LTEEQYKLICETCDRVLLETKITIERVSITWLHVLNEHPLSLAKYTGIFTGMLPKFIGIKSLLYILSRGAQLLKKSPRWYSSSGDIEQADVIFVSNLLNESQASERCDFYFGSVQEDLAKKGVSSLIVYHNHTGLDAQYLSLKFQSNATPRLIFSSTLSWKEELNLVRRLSKEAKGLRMKVKENEDLFYNKILEASANQALSMTSIFALRFYCQMKNVIELARPKSIIVLYEGHAWERLAFAAARSIFPDIRCIGYQHAILFPRQHALKRKINSYMDPDAILTAGNIARDFLNEEESLHNVEISTVGTHRQAGLPIDLTEKLSSTNKQHSCLIIPDGNMCECLTIIKFSIDAALLLPNIKFIIRMHPLLTFRDVAKLDNRLNQLPENIEISTFSIDDDFKRSRWAVYRGSGAAVHAVVSGLRPFYLALPNELDIDPLFNLTVWKHVIHEPSELVLHVNNDLNISINELNESFKIANTYCREYFMSVNKEFFCEKILGEI